MFDASHPGATLLWPEMARALSSEHPMDLEWLGPLVVFISNYRLSASFK